MKARWRAIIGYRHATGVVDVEHFLEELADLHDLVERGPHWDTITSISIFRIHHCDAADLTVERAATI